jgi:serine racemase
MSAEGCCKYCITFEDVEAAAVRIKGVAHITPVLTSQSLDRKSGRNLYFKVEALQKTGSFKFRGALNAVKSIIEERSGENEIQVVTHSSGNHAQALALAAKEASGDGVLIHATIVMPYSTPSVKKAAVEDYGGIPVMTESTNESRERECDRILKETQAKFVHPSEDPRVIAGQGTACLELIQQIKEMGVSSLEAVIIPVSLKDSIRILQHSRILTISIYPLYLVSGWWWRVSGREYDNSSSSSG